MSGPLTPQLLMRAYACGLFPMAESRDSAEIYWVDPKKRGVLPLDGMILSRSLRKRIRQGRFRVTVNEAFGDVIEACAEPAQGREETWINDTIFDLYRQLNALGAAHSVECWQDGRLVGGLYGVDLAGAFFGESMFHRATDASKVALAHLVARLRAGGYSLLDCQFQTDHLASLGVVEVSRSAYHDLLRKALDANGNFQSLGSPSEPADVMHWLSQMS